MDTTHQIVDQPEPSSWSPSPSTIALIVVAVVVSAFLVGALLLALTMWSRGDEGTDQEAGAEAQA